MPNAHVRQILLSWTAVIKLQHKSCFQSNTVRKKLKRHLPALVGPCSTIKKKKCTLAGLGPYSRPRAKFPPIRKAQGQWHTLPWTIFIEATSHNLFVTGQEGPYHLKGHTFFPSTYYKVILSQFPTLYQIQKKLGQIKPLDFISFCPFLLNFSNGLVYGGLAGKQNRRRSFAMEIKKNPSILRGCFREDLFTCMSLHVCRFVSFVAKQRKTSNAVRR